MVVFTCNHCGDSLQKPKVEKHYQIACRRVKSLTCVDCLKDFHGEDYNVHTKCITEQERYAAKGSLPNGVVKKGEVKQESWLDMIRSIIDKEQNLSPKLKNLLESIAEYNNVPRKKHKFMNFIKNSSGRGIDMKIVEDVWNIIEKYKAEMSKPDPAAKKEEKDEENTAKRKLDDKEEEVPKKKVKGTESNEKCTSEIDASMTNEEGGNISKKKKKGKKSKNETEKEEAEINGNNAEGVPIKKEQDDTGEQITKKKKKGKKENGVGNSASDAEKSIIEAVNGLNGAEQDEDILKKKKKKSKKETEKLEEFKQDVEVDSNTNDKEIILTKKEQDENGQLIPKKNKKEKENIKNGEPTVMNGEAGNKECTEAELDSTKAGSKENAADNTMEVDDDNGFSFEDTITNIMKKKKTTSLKKLQKKVMNAYLKHTGQSEVTAKNIKKCNKKLHKAKTIKIELDNVTLIE